MRKKNEGESRKERGEGGEREGEKVTCHAWGVVGNNYSRTVLDTIIMFPFWWEDRLSLKGREWVRKWKGKKGEKMRKWLIERKREQQMKEEEWKEWMNRI